jgi:hypothetical protein
MCEAHGYVIEQHAHAAMHLTHTLDLHIKLHPRVECANAVLPSMGLHLHVRMQLT